MIEYDTYWLHGITIIINYNVINYFIFLINMLTLHMV